MRVPVATRPLLLVFLALPAAQVLTPAHAMAASCAARSSVILASRSPVEPGGISRTAGLDYFQTFTTRNYAGRQAAFGFITGDPICGPHGPREIIRSTPTANHSGPYPGLEPDGKTFAIVYTAGNENDIRERLASGVYTRPATFQSGLVGITMQRIGNSLSRLTISIDKVNGKIYTQTVRSTETRLSVEPATWGSLLETPFAASTGATGNNRRATAAWTGNPDRPSEIVMAWANAEEGSGNRRIRYAIDSNYTQDGGWSAARTLVEISGKDLSDTRVFRWGRETRVYFVARDTDGASRLGYMASVDHGRSWSGPFEVPIPRIDGSRLVGLSAPTMSKTRDGSSPIVVIGGYDRAESRYELVAFKQI